MNELEQEKYIRPKYNKARALFRKDITNLENKGKYLMWKYALMQLHQDLRGESQMTQEEVDKVMEEIKQE